MSSTGFAQTRSRALAHRSATALIALVVVCVLAGDAAAQDDVPDPRQRVTVPVAGAPSLGADNALVTIVEFSDFYCPYCRSGTATLNSLMRIYDGRVRVVYRHSLLDATNASLAAQAALAAQARGLFWPFHDRLFAGPAPTTIDDLSDIAEELGIDRTAFRHELETGVHRKRLGLDLQIAQALGVTGIPVFFINGRRVSGAQPLGVFVRLIEEELQIAGELVTGGTPPEQVYARLARPTAEIAAKVSGKEQIYVDGVDESKLFAVRLGRPAASTGSAAPLVTIVEFSDFDCGYCARAHPVLLKAIEDHPGDVRLIYRHYPLGGVTKEVAEAAEEAGSQGKFWEFAEQVFTTRATGRSDLFAHARKVGLDLDRFRRALDERTHAQVVASDAAEGAGFGVTGTPTLFVNGRPVLGAPPPDALEKLIDEEIVAARALLAQGVERDQLYEQLTARQGPAPPVANASRPDRIEIDPIDYHIAVLLACRDSNDETALRFYKEVTDSRRRASLRRDCKRLGVILPK